MLMSFLVALLVALLVFALCYWLIKQFVPAPFKTPALLILAIIALIWLLYSAWPMMRNP